MNWRNKIAKMWDLPQTRAGFMSDEFRGFAEPMFRILLDAAPDAILIVDERGIIRHANNRSRDLFLYELDELLDQPVEILMPQGFVEGHVALRSEYFARPSVRAMGSGLTISARRKDGTLLPVEISLSPVKIGDRGFAVTVVRDVEDLRKTQRELKEKAAALEKSNRDLEQFAYVASHDLQEPLRMVGSYTALLKRRYADKLEPDAVEFIDFAVAGVKRMQDLITDLLVFSRISSKDAGHEELDLASVVEQAKSNLALAIQDKQAQVSVQGVLPRVSGDRGQLVQLFQNLIGNAMKFCERTPDIKVSARVSGGEFVEITVSDNGIGIEKTYLEKIFKIFQRLHDRDQYEGTGIGLAICEKVVLRHGGHIWVESAPGSGSTFFFTLPRATS